MMKAAADEIERELAEEDARKAAAEAEEERRRVADAEAEAKRLADAEAELVGAEAEFAPGSPLAGSSDADPLAAAIRVSERLDREAAEARSALARARSKQSESVSEAAGASGSGKGKGRENRLWCVVYLLFFEFESDPVFGSCDRCKKAGLVCVTESERHSCQRCHNSRQGCAYGGKSVSEAKREGKESVVEKVGPPAHGTRQKTAAARPKVSPSPPVSVVGGKRARPASGSVGAEPRIRAPPGAVIPVVEVPPSRSTALTEAVLRLTRATEEATALQRRLADDHQVERERALERHLDTMEAMEGVRSALDRNTETVERSSVGGRSEAGSRRTGMDWASRQGGSGTGVGSSVGGSAQEFGAGGVVGFGYGDGGEDEESPIPLVDDKDPADPQEESGAGPSGA